MNADRRGPAALLMPGGEPGAPALDLDALCAALVEELDVPVDPRRLRPADLARLLNSTPLGAVLDDRHLRQHRNRAGYRIGDDKTIDLLRYTAWLVSERHRLRGYAAHKERARQRQLALATAGRDIGALPDVADPARRAGAQRDFRGFCETYFPHTFCLPWSDDHLRVLRLIETVVLTGGLFAIAMPRGNGKTSLCEAAAVWALVYGHRPFVAIIGPDESHAAGRVQNIRTDLEHNDLLAADFPEICVPIRRLEGINQRRLLYRGAPVRMEFTAKRIVLPNLPGSPAAGAVVATAGLTGQIRGLNFKRDDGTVIRPSLVLIDDPQTDESAHSPSQCAQRERIINGAVLGLAGPGTKIAALLPCTVVRADDLADRLLNREKNPQWQGERTKLVYRWPTNEALWQRYVELRREAQRAQQPPHAAHELYRSHRAAMDEGAVVAWTHRFNADELSAIQHAWNIRADRGEAAFWAEYQNEPLPELAADTELLDADALAGKVNGYARGTVPLTTTHLTMFIDVQAKALFWIVAAWQEDFTGFVVDYGTEPEQKLAYFTLRDIRRTLAVAAPRAGLEGAIYAGLERLCAATVGRDWAREDGSRMRIERCLIDANWGTSTDVVYQFCRQSVHAGLLLPAHGRYVGAASIPFSDYKRKRGDRVGLNWRIPVAAGRRAVRHVLFDANYWKSFLHARLAVPLGDPGNLSLYGRKAETHRLLAEHLTSEYRVKTEGRGRTVDEWKLRAAGLDNHWLDGLVGCAVGASLGGAAPPGLEALGPPAPRRTSYAERYTRWQHAR